MLTLIFNHLKCILTKSVDGENKIVYDFDQCGTEDPSVTFQYIEYTGTLYHAADENNDAASGRLYTFNPDFDCKFTCKIERALVAASGSVTVTEALGVNESTPT